MIHTIVPGFLGLFFVQIVFSVQTAGNVLFGVDDDLTHFTGSNTLAFGVYNVDIILGRSLAHRTQLRCGTYQVGDGQSGFGLAEAFHDLQTRGFLELFEDFRVQCLTGGSHVVDGAQIVLRQVATDQHTQHSGRCAEGGDVVLCEHGQNVVFVETIEVVDEDRAFTQPLTVELAPQGLTPTGIGDGQMQTITLTAMPVLGCHIVTQSIGVLVGSHLGIAGGTGGEEHQGDVIAGASIGRTIQVTSEQTIFCIQIMPAFLAATN